MLTLNSARASSITFRDLLSNIGSQSASSPTLQAGQTVGSLLSRFRGTFLLFDGQVGE
jgi:hypothetical protein